MPPGIQQRRAGFGRTAASQLARVLLLAALAAGPVTGGRAQSAAIPPIVTPLAAIRQVKAEFPAELKRTGVLGVVVVEFTVTIYGTTTNIHAVSSTDHRLTHLATEAVAKWRYHPRTVDGVPKASFLRVPFKFDSPGPGNTGRPQPRGDHPPIPRLQAKPQYPFEFASARVEGEITIDFTVGIEGLVSEVKIVRSPDPRLSRMAEDAVESWLFYPAVKKGLPTRARMEAPIVFQPPAGAKATDSELDPVAAKAAADRAKAEAEMAAGNAPAAAADYSASVQLAPDAPQGYLGRARAYAALGRVDEALQDFGQAASMDAADQAALDAYRKTLADTPQRRWSSVRFETFSTVWRTVYETYFDPAFGGVDWLAVREKYRLRLDSAADNTALVALLQQMLGELRRTHFAILPRDAAVFNPSERVRIGTAGVEVAFIDGGVSVTEVREGSTGYAAGIRPGDLVVAVDGVELAGPMAALEKAGIPEGKRRLYATQFVESRLSSAVGTVVSLILVGPGKDGLKRIAKVTCAANDAEWSEPIGYFPSFPIRYEARRDAGGLAYLRFNIFVPPVMKRIRPFLRSLQAGDGLVIDLRGNGGGISVMAAGICGCLCRDPFALGTVHQRVGASDLAAYPQKDLFTGPVAILTDGLSASTSEILAAALQEKHRARVFGELTAGAALPSLFKNLPTGDLFQYAIGDVTTPSGAMIEGTGVKPDEVVVRTRAEVAAGRDAVLDAARLWLDGARSAAVAKSSGGGT